MHMTRVFGESQTCDLDPAAQITVTGKYIASSFGSSIQNLVPMFRPVTDIETATLIDLVGLIYTCRSNGNIKELYIGVSRGNMQLLNLGAERG